MNKIIGYSHVKESGALETPKNPFHCVDCTNKRFTEKEFRQFVDLALTSADVDKMRIYLKEFKQLPMKNIFCGTCGKLIAN